MNAGPLNCNLLMKKDTVIFPWLKNVTSPVITPADCGQEQKVCKSNAQTWHMMISDHSTL